MMILLNNALLTTTFQASAPFGLVGDHVVLDSIIVVANTGAQPPGTPAQVEWYPEFTFDDPNSTTARWFRETAEEDLGNGDVRMPKTVRRWSENGDDLPLATGTHNLDAQFSRKHNYCRIQIRVSAAPVSADACRASLFAVIGSDVLSAP